MASFLVLVTLVMAVMASFSLCLSPELKLDSPITTISAAPALLPSPSLSPPFTEISPDVAPLLPSPGGELPASSGSSTPTIPSNPSPPNPDQVASLGPGFVASPTGSELMSAAFCGRFSGFLSLAVLVGLMLCW